jgi:hypothetical protein
MRLTIDPAPSTSPPPAPPAEPSWSQPGALGIQERRSWATWQLVVAVAVAGVLGMMVGYSGKKPSAEAGTGRPIVSLGGLTATTPTTVGGAAPTAAATTATTPTTVAGAAPTAAATTATTAMTETTVTTAAPAPAAAPTVLMPNTPGTGPSDLPAFTAAGPWNIGWHFRCVNAPAGTGTFTVEVVPDAGAPAAPPVQQTSREGQGITPQTAAGRQHLKITTDPACQWAVKVTGIAP